MIQPYIDYQPVQLICIPKDVVQGQSQSFLCLLIRISLAGICVEGRDSEIADRVMQHSKLYATIAVAAEATSDITVRNQVPCCFPVLILQVIGISTPTVEVLFDVNRVDPCVRILKRFDHAPQHVK